jgi:hypothetical protein
VGEKQVQGTGESAGGQGLGCSRLLSHPKKQLLFALLSGADLLLTWWLLDHSAGVFESNPLACWWLARYGWLGLAAFKASVATLVLVLAVVVCRHRPRVAGRLLQFGCGTLVLVVLYSGSLCWAVARSPEEREIAAARQQGQQLQERSREAETYGVLLEQAGEELIAGKSSLSQAVQQLQDSKMGRNPAWLRKLAEVYRGRSPQECLAANLIQRLVASRQEDPQAARCIAQRLQREFEFTYGDGSPAPRAVAQLLP